MQSKGFENLGFFHKIVILGKNKGKQKKKAKTGQNINTRNDK
jgi:hypothetical protein